MDLLCRLCMKTCILHTDASEDKLSQMLQDLFTIQIICTDVSKIVCNDCLNIVTTFYEFFKQVKRVQDFFFNKTSENAMMIKNEDSVEHGSLDTVGNFDIANVKSEYSDHYRDDLSFDINFSNESILLKDNSSELNGVRCCSNFKSEFSYHVKDNNDDYIMFSDEARMARDDSSIFGDIQRISNVKNELTDLHRNDCTDCINFSTEAILAKHSSPTLAKDYSSLNLNKHIDNISKNDNVSNNFSTQITNFEASEEIKVDSLISNNIVTVENETVITSSNNDYPSEIIKNGKFVLTGLPLENLIKKFYHLECDICIVQVNFSKLLELFQHYEREHKTRGYITCCNSKLFRRNTICYHMAQHLQPGAFQCSVCQKTVSRPDALRLHMRTHLPETERPYKCDECDKRYNSKDNLFHHKLSHVPINEREKFECEICGKIFSIFYLYNLHKKAAHIKAENLCSICGRNFRMKSGLTKHMITHNPPETPKLKCPECGVLCKNKLTFRRHVKNHSLDTVKCSLCDYSTRFKRKLSVHMQRKHSDLKPNRCIICGKGFKIKENLKVHMVQHTGERKYTCSFCPKTFASPSNCYTHRKRMHIEEYNNLIKTKLINSKVM